MLEIIVKESEMFDEQTETFIYIPKTVLRLEHSLVSISKWESKFKKPFLENSSSHTDNEMLEYIKMMTITQNVNPKVYLGLDKENITAISSYINDPMTATWFTEQQNRKAGKEVVTSELIYYWMIALNVPMECQKWHLNRLLTLIKVCDIKQESPKKMSKSTTMSRNHALNEARRAKMHSKG